MLDDKIRGSLIGGAIGDALGYQIEFSQGIASGEVTRFARDIGIISDDTQMTLFTVCALLWRETRYSIRGIAALPYEAIYLGYLDWLGTQQRVDEHTNVSWIRNIPELNILRDPGNTCIEALSSGQRGTLGVPINNSKGCGGIMRIAPIALSLQTPVVGDFSARSCAITHGHPLAILSAFVLGLIIHYVACDYPLSKAINTAIDDMLAWVPEDVDEHQKLKKLRYKAEKVELANLLRSAAEFAHSNISDAEAIRRLGGGWVAEEALAIAIFCVLRHENDFSAAVIAAANHDGDSDSTAAITGNIMGAKLGYDAIPAYFRDHVELRDVILELADDLASGVPLDSHGECVDEPWLAKYLYCNKAT